MEITDLRKLVKKCAFEMNADDKWRIDRGETVYGHGVARDPDFSRLICEQVARGAGLPEMGLPVYLMLAHAWNDALDWADRGEEEDGTTIR